MRVPVLSSAVFDDNRDGKPDRVEVNVQMPIRPTESVNSFTVLLYFNSQFSDQARYYFDSVAFYNYDTAAAMASLSVDGDYILRQTWPFDSSGGYKVPYEDDQLIQINSDSSATDISISTMMREYNSRNCKLELLYFLSSVAHLIFNYFYFLLQLRWFIHQTINTLQNLDLLWY